MNAALIDSLVKRVLKGVVEKGATKPEQLVCASNAALTAYFSTLLNGGTRDTAERVLSSIADNFMHVAKGLKSLETGAKKVASLVYEGAQGMDADKQERIYDDVLDAVKKYSKGTSEERLVGGAETQPLFEQPKPWRIYENNSDTLDKVREFLQELRDNDMIVDYEFRPKTVIFSPYIESGYIDEFQPFSAGCRPYSYFVDPYYGVSGGSPRFNELRGRMVSDDKVEPRLFNAFSPIYQQHHREKAVLRDAVVDLYVKDPNNPKNIQKVFDLPIGGIAYYCTGRQKLNKMRELKKKFEENLPKWINDGMTETVAREREWMDGVVNNGEVMKKVLFPNDPDVRPTESSLQEALRSRLKTSDDIAKFLEPYVNAFRLDKKKWENVVKELVDDGNHLPKLPAKPLFASTSPEEIKNTISDINDKQAAMKEIPLLLNTLNATPDLGDVNKKAVLAAADEKLEELFMHGDPSGYETYAGEKYPYRVLSDEESKFFKKIGAFLPLKFLKDRQFSDEPLQRIGPKLEQDLNDFNKMYGTNYTAQDYLKGIGTNRTFKEFVADIDSRKEQYENPYREIDGEIEKLLGKVEKKQATKTDYVNLFGLRLIKDKDIIENMGEKGTWSYSPKLNSAYEVAYRKFFDIYMKGENGGKITAKDANLLLKLGAPLLRYGEALIEDKDISEIEKTLREIIPKEDIEEFEKKSFSSPEGHTTREAEYKPDFEFDFGRNSTSTSSDKEQQNAEWYESFYSKMHPEAEKVKPPPKVKIEPTEEPSPLPQPSQLPGEKDSGFWAWAKENPPQAMALFGAMPAAIGGLVKFGDAVGKLAYVGLSHFKPRWADWFDAHWPGGLVKGVGHALEDIADFAPAIFRDYMEAAAKQDAYAVQQAQVQARNDAAMENYKQQVSYQKYVDELKDKMTKMEIEQAKKEREHKEAEIEYQRNEIRRENLYKDEEDARKERNYERQFALDRDRDKINARNFKRAEEYKEEKALYDERERRKDLALDTVGSMLGAATDVGRMAFGGVPGIPEIGKKENLTGNVAKTFTNLVKLGTYESAPIAGQQEYVSQMKAREDQQKSYKRGEELPGAGPERLVKDNIHSAPIAKPVLEVAPARPMDFRTTNIDAAYNRIRSRWEARERMEAEEEAKRRAQKEEDKRTAMEYLQNFKADQEVRRDVVLPVSAGIHGRALTTRLQPLQPSFPQQEAIGRKRPVVDLRRNPPIFPLSLSQKKQSEEPKRKRRRKK